MVLGQPSSEIIRLGEEYKGKSKIFKKKLKGFFRYLLRRNN